MREQPPGEDASEGGLQLTAQWEDQALFDAGPATPAPLKVGEDAARTARRRALLAAGWHPTSGRRLRGGDEVCGTCAHCVGFRRHTRTYWKCAEVAVTRGAATDVRLSWPACVAWEPEE